MTPPTPALAAASDRLRDTPGFPRRPGRPRKAKPTPATPAVALIAPRLLDLPAAAAYLGVSTWTVRDLEAAGTVRRVRVPLPNGGELRKVLFDRDELDRLVEGWRS